MSDIRSENFSLRKSEPTEHTVRPCFCCDMKHETFYNFINIWDIITFCFAITGSIMEISIGRMVSSVGLFLNIVLLVMVIIAYVIYYNQKNYGQFIHKFYGTTRLVVVCLELLAVVVVFFVAIFIRLPRHISPYRWVMVLGVVLAGLLVGLNLYWSLLLMKVVSRRSRMEHGYASEEPEEPQEPAVALENVQSESVSRAEGDAPEEDQKTPKSVKDLSDLVK